MIIQEVKPLECGVLRVVAEDGRSGTVDVSPCLEIARVCPSEEQGRTRSDSEWEMLRCEWTCGADLSADTLEAGMQWAGQVFQSVSGEEGGSMIAMVTRFQVMRGRFAACDSDTATADEVSEILDDADCPCGGE